MGNGYWTTYILPSEEAFVPYFKCLTCGARGHLREDCTDTRESE